MYMYIYMMYVTRNTNIIHNTFACNLSLLVFSPVSLCLFLSLTVSVDYTSVSVGRSLELFLN